MYVRSRASCLENKGGDCNLHSKPRTMSSNDQIQLAELGEYILVSGLETDILSQKVRCFLEIQPLIQITLEMHAA